MLNKAHFYPSHFCLIFSYFFQFFSYFLQFFTIFYNFFQFFGLNRAYRAETGLSGRNVPIGSLSCPGRPVVNRARAGPITARDVPSPDFRPTGRHGTARLPIGPVGPGLIRAVPYVGRAVPGRAARLASFGR